MTFTKAQRRVVNEIENLLRIGSYDWRVVETLYEPDARLPQLKRIKLDFLRAKVIGDYVFVDELLTVIIVSYFFPVNDFPKRWKNKKMITFMHFVMEELFMLRKLALVQEIRDFDGEMAQMIPEELVQGVDLGDVGIDHAREVVGHTLLWLYETGYLLRKGDITPHRFTLSPKGFEVLDASPFPSQETNQPAVSVVEETVGERLMALTKETLTSEGKEQLKSLVHRAFGWGMTYIAAKASGILP